MDSEMKFRFVVPPAPAGPLIELSADEAERMFLAALDANEDRKQALWNLAQFYKIHGQHEKALERLRELIALLPDPESKAECIFTMGQAMEGAGDFEAAVKYYRAATTLEPASPCIWYFIHNNLGFSLNTLGRFEEGELYCRRAIAIDPNRPNGHKNLGIALASRGNYQDAARSFITATQVNAADARSLRLLEKLAREHPELEIDLKDEIENCELAVNVAAEKLQASQPKVVRGSRKHIALWWVKARKLFTSKK
jgi:tetratricopeptide (TPR) repeat protein